MSGDRIKEMSMDLVSDLGIFLKYHGDDLNQIKNQLYQLLKIHLGKEKSKNSDKKAIGMVVDVESMFGKGKEIDHFF